MTKLKFFTTILLSLMIVACGGGGSAPPPPVISSQPASVTVFDTQDAAFAVTATDAGPITYQWLKNDAVIQGATSSTWINTASLLADNGASITVAITGNGGTVKSSVATLTVVSRAPKVVTDPTPQSVTAGQPVNLSVTATGLPSLSYQWLKNGQTIPGAISSSYSTPVTLGDNGALYSVKITNTISSVTSNPATLTVNPSSLAELVISEVSTCYYYYVDCWFELYNPTSQTKSLSNYSVKSLSIDTTVGGFTAVTNFSLPNINIAPDSYVIISGNNGNLIQRGVQNIRLRIGNQVPFWTSDGFIELLNSGSTADFVSFGTSTQTPTTSGKWTGVPVTKLLSSATDFGKSIVRPYPRTADTNTRSASDWVSVDWVTPAGRNDIPVGAKDDDGDGIPDSAEVIGGTFAGLDLYSMGARAGQKDILIELDSMRSTDEGIIPRSESLQMVVSSFAVKGINVMFDAGTAFSPNFSVKNFNLGQGSSIVPYEACVTLNQTTCNLNISNKRSVYDWKEENMDLRRRSLFHYLLMGSTQLANGGALGSSGVAEIQGNDFIVTLGNWYLNTSNSTNKNRLINFQASTIMHELGHNLGLRHGGNENLNYKPNYWSIMNYLYDLRGLDPDPASKTAYQRWRNQKGDGTPKECDLVASPCGDQSQYIMSYSNGFSAILNESSLLESSNVGRGNNASAYADWNMDGQLTSTAISKDLNGDGSLTILTDYDDWANLYFPFARNVYGNAGPSLNKTQKNILNPVSNDRQDFIIETHTVRDLNR